MNLAELHHKLITAARLNSPSERVPYGFEARILARLRDAHVVDRWTLWAKALWRASAPCVAVMLLLVTWSFFATTANAPGGNAPRGNLAQEFDNLVLAAATQVQLVASSW
jgi:hypothetical protein